MKKKLLKLLIISAFTFTTLIGCGNVSEDEVKNNLSIESENTTDQTQDIYDAVVKAYGEDYYPSLKLDEETITNMIGLTPDMYESCIAEGPRMSSQVDTFIVVKATEGKSSEVTDKLTEYRDSLIYDTLQYPMNMLKIQASKVVTEGDYVFFIMLGASDNKLKEDDEIYQHFSVQNDIAINTIESFFNK